MQNAVTTLPISPVTEPHLGLCLIPLLADLIGESLGLEKVLALNIHGLKYELASPQSEKIRIAQSYLASLAHLNIKPDHIWRDDLNEFAVFAQIALTDLLNRNVLKIKRVPIARCQCGKVEYLEGAQNLSLRRRLFEEADGRRICKLCKTQLQVHEIETCLFTFNPDRERFLGIPSFAEKEIRVLANSFMGLEYLVSRTRVTHFSLNLPGLRDFDIDPDFLWSLMLPYLQSIGYKVKLLVGSRRNMLACLFIGTLAQAFDCEDPIFVFPPYLVGPKKANIKIFGTADQMTARFGSDVVRTFLMSGLNWEIAQAVINPTLLEYLASLDRNLLQQACYSILPKSVRMITQMSGFNVKKAITVLRKKKIGEHQ